MDFAWLNTPYLVWGDVRLTVLGTGLLVLTLIGVVLAARLMRILMGRLLQRVNFLEEVERRTIARIAAYLVLVFGGLAAVEAVGLAVGKPLLFLGGTGISLYSVATSLALAGAVFTGAQVVSRWISQRALARSDMDEGLRYAIGRISYYILLVLGMMAVFQTLGVQMGSITVLLGAMGVGIGFGLQNIVNNFVSGLILLFERPIKVGDWIEIDEVSGRVTEIGARSTKIITQDNITMIIPNGDCLSEHLTNWSYAGSRVRFRFPVGVAYGSDMDKVQRLLLEVGAEHPKVLKNPRPKVLFKGFGEYSLDLQLGVWIEVGSIGLQQLRSDLYFAIEKKFRDGGVEIPFPQREIVVRSMGVTEPDVEHTSPFPARLV